MDHQVWVTIRQSPRATQEALADIRDIEAAYTLSAVVRAVLEGSLTADELAAFVPLLRDALDRVIVVAARGFE